MTRDSWLRTAHEFLQVILNDETKNWAFFAEFKQVQCVRKTDLIAELGKVNTVKTRD